MRARSTRATRRLCTAAVVGTVAGAAALASSATAADAPTLNESGGAAATQLHGTVNAGGAALRSASVDLYWARAR